MPEACCGNPLHRCKGCGEELPMRVVRHQHRVKGTAYNCNRKCWWKAYVATHPSERTRKR